MFNKYRELGLPLIPIRAYPIEKMKAPIPEGWQEFCERLPTEEECDHWEAQGHKRYGLALGPASGVMAVDIDSDDIKIINAVKLSPVRKRGKKGETRFFRYDNGVPSTKVAGCIDILALGRQTLLPPTTHPEGMPYVWLTPDTLENYSVQDLPWFTPDDLADLRRALEPEKYEIGDESGTPLTGGPWHNDDAKRLCPHGSHDRLKRIANAIIARGASPDEAVRELLRYDDENHFPVGYFKDSTRPDYFADPVSNALYFYASNLKTFNRRQVKSGQMSAVPLVSGSEILEIGPAVALTPDEWKPLEWPEPEGLLKDIRDQILDFSLRHQPGLALGGAIAIAAASISNKLKTGRTWPNVYIMNVAPTGAGKSFPYDTAKRLLNTENGLDVIGAGGYRSSTAMIKDLLGRRERLDLLDECSGFLKTVRDGGIFQADMMDILNSLWSESSSVFIGPESAGRERVTVWHPCVSVLFSTTPDGLKNSISREFVTQGFIPRCLIFHDSEYGKIGGSKWDESRAEKIVRGLQEMASWGKTNAKNLVAPKPEPDEIEITPGAIKMLDEYALECAHKLSEKDREELDRHFLSRAAQQATKLALIHGALRKLQIAEVDVSWAIGVLKAIWHNATPIMPQMGAENVQETNVLRVLQIIRSAGSMSLSNVIAKTRFLKTSERNDILGSLESEGRIASSFTDKRARLFTFIR